MPPSKAQLNLALTNIYLLCSGKDRQAFRASGFRPQNRTARPSACRWKKGRLRNASKEEFGIVFVYFDSLAQTNHGNYSASSRLGSQFVDHLVRVCRKYHGRRKRNLSRIIPWANYFRTEFRQIVSIYLIDDTRRVGWQRR
ncbi:sulfite reductase subunit beta [Anopheles sinensis]|uniref:Sulfite reductase subunit beta n=1 Tax=Anopheles sinensis TaxID=74873 RepID=A0A084VXH4_ANOSI|nr:sulfite reductase subunit beta [Anopheles sinensis]